MKYGIAILGILTIGYACQLTTVRLDEYEVHGIDVSHYQSFINWNEVAEQDIDFAFMKATEGLMLVDTLFEKNWGQSKAMGIKRGAYHFYRPTLSAEVQARNFMGAVELEHGDLPPVLDVEVLDGVSKIELLIGVRTWLYLAEIHYGVKPILYSNLKFYNKYLAGHFTEYPIWIARYSNRLPRLACGTDWQFWQYGNRGRLNGIEGDVDFNVFHGSMEELESLCVQPVSVFSEDPLPLPLTSQFPNRPGNDLNAPLPSTAELPECYLSMHH